VAVFYGLFSAPTETVKQFSLITDRGKFDTPANRVGVAGWRSLLQQPKQS
jgi:hypothetical protein